MKCLCARTRLAARLLTKYYEEELRPANLTPAQFELLGTLLQRPGLSQSSLAEALCLDQTTLSRNLKVLTGRALIERASSAKDRRETSYALTAEGRTVWRQALPHWRHAQERIKHSLKGSLRSTWATLDNLIGAL